MKRAVEKVAAGQWPKGAAVGTITLAFDDRFRRRIRMATDQGVELLLDLARAERLDEGDGLKLEDGGIVEVRAADEDVLEIVCDTPQALARVAWHLGNRHLATEIRGSSLRIRPDHVIEEMARGLGAQVRIIRAPFRPEGGAYAKGASHPGHGHRHPHGHGHGDGHDHRH